jgi:hypothetical protein
MVSRLYLTLAQTLVAGVRAAAPLTGGTGAAECRCAISRAYYAAYNVAVDFLDRLGFETTNNHNCHQAVQFALNQSGNTSLRDVSTYLNTLHTERRRADYEMRNARPEQVSHADTMVKLAESAISLVETVQGDTSLWGSIAIAVLNYVNTSQTAALRRKSGTK